VRTEVDVLMQLKEAGFDGFSRILLHGYQQSGLLYVIMHKYGPSLKCMLRRSKHKRISVKSSIQIGI
jgi:hypothetical protein